MRRSVRSVVVELGKTSRIEFHPLRIAKDGDEYNVGRPEIRSYLAMSKSALAALEYLRGGMDMASASNKVTADFGSLAADLDSFVKTLLDAGFAKALFARKARYGGHV